MTKAPDDKFLTVSRPAGEPRRMQSGVASLGEPRRALSILSSATSRKSTINSVRYHKMHDESERKNDASDNEDGRKRHSFTSIRPEPKRRGSFTGSFASLFSRVSKAPNPFEAHSFSVKMDAPASVEHQIDIHVMDLVEVSDQTGFSLSEILEGLKFIMDYEIRGGKMQRLNFELMERLLEGLLQNMDHEAGSLKNKHPTMESDLAFILFGEFMEEVEDFRLAVGTKSATDLRQALNIYRRCHSSKIERENAAAILHLLTTHFIQFRDWRELVTDNEQADVQKLVNEYAPRFKDGDASMPLATETIFPPPALYFDKNSEKLAEMFGSDVQNGLPSSKIPELQARYGPNSLPSPPKVSALKIMWGQVTDFMVMIIVIAAVIQASMGEIDPCVILLIVGVINVTIGFGQEYKANKSLEALSSLSVPYANVIRDGKQETIESSQLVPGDLVCLEEGDAVPADLRLCEVSQLTIVEAVLTGESVGAEKSIRTIRKKSRRLPLGDCNGNAFMTTVVQSGRGKGIVIRVGEQTEIGKISKAIVTTGNEITPIQRKITKLGILLVVVATTLSLAVICIGIGYGNNAADMVKVGVTLAVAVIPEGLVAVVTVTLALAVTRMSKKNAIVRKLGSVETLGSVTHICSDKTGTLTEGKMCASGLWTSDNSQFSFTYPTGGKDGHVNMTARVPLATALGDIATHGSTQKGETDICHKTLTEAPTHLVAACMVAALCSNASLEVDPESETGFKSTGDATEVAIVAGSQIAGFPKAYFEDTIGLEKLGEYAFNSDRKLMSVIYGQRIGSTGSDKFSADTGFVLAKGAPEGILLRCTSYLPPVQDESVEAAVARGDGKAIQFLSEFPVQPMSEDYVNYLSARSEAMASQGLRVLALAVRKVSRAVAHQIVDSKKLTEAECELTFVGLIGLIDPPKAGVQEAIQKCHKAGINVIMITGDHVTTAAAIARDIGIVNDQHSRCMRGPELDLLSEEALAELRPFPVVFARVSPDNKLKIVKALQSHEYVVAMTGDGVNDAPAIKKADIGVAMGIGGTEITKQAAEIVLSDDNFATIVEAVREGRLVFDNIKKFVVYLLSCNSAEIVLFLVCAIVNVPMPFTSMQVLWANIIADIPPALSLGVEVAELNILDRPPRLPGTGILDKMAWQIIGFQGLVQSMSTFAVYMLSKQGVIQGDLSTLPQQQSLAFACLTSMQLCQSFMSRSSVTSIFKTGLISNPWLVFGFLLSYALLLAGIFTPGLRHWIDLEHVYSGWEAILGCVVVQLVMSELMKCVVRKAVKKENENYDPEAALRKRLNDQKKAGWLKKYFDF
ncbi:P-type ATPase [Podochytrium sp. JEL0797]|nr:P-type ATPase [Podochytrium sp. JEL0797]